jgi:putative transposase
MKSSTMLGLLRYRSALITTADIEATNRIRKGQFEPGRLGIKEIMAPKFGMQLSPHERRDVPKRFASFILKVWTRAVTGMAFSLGC